MKLKRLLIYILTMVPMANIHAGCDREPRSLSYDGSPITVYVSESLAEISLPKERYIKALRPDITEGLAISESKIKNKFGVTVTDDAYSSLVRIDGGSGRTYLLNLLSRPGCPDSLVTIEVVNTGDADWQNANNRTSNGKYKGLMSYLLNDETPKGYRKKTFKHAPKQELLIFKQGSVEFYLHEQLIGRRYTGSTYRLINNGRTPFRIGMENINYSDPQIKESLGKAREVAMLPTTRRLGAAPEYVSDMFAADNEGLLFIVSENP